MVHRAHGKASVWPIVHRYNGDEVKRLSFLYGSSKVITLYTCCIKIKPKHLKKRFGFTTGHELMAY